MAKGLIVTLNVERMPEMIWAARREMAQMLREVAQAESDPRVTRKLHEVADAYEAGQRSA